MRSLVSACFALWLGSNVALPAAAQCPPPYVNDECTKGQWAGPWDWVDQLNPPPSPACDNDELSHAALIPEGNHAGKVLMWRYGFVPGMCSSPNTVETWLFNPNDPDTLIRVEHPALASEIFCGGLSWDANGKLIVAGGIDQPGGTIPEQTYRFNPKVLGTAVWPPSIPGQPPGTPYVPQSNCWVQIGSMNIKRYYPTLVGLSRSPISTTGCTNGYSSSHLVLSGPPAISSEGNEVLELLDLASASWSCPLIPETMTSQSSHWDPSWTTTEEYLLKPAPTTPPFEFLDSYARTLQLDSSTGGQLVVVGDVATVSTIPPVGNDPGAAWALNVPYFAGDDWEMWEATPSGVDRFYGSAALLHTPSVKNRVLVFGGSEYDNSLGVWTTHTSVQEFEPGSDAASGIWRPKIALINARVYCNAVVLPTGDVLVEGGGAAPFGSAQIPVLEPELYSPGSQPTDLGSSTVLAESNATTAPGGGSNPTPRLYHHLAVLLPDGRVLVAGGSDRGDPAYPDSEYTGEVYSPPYLFQGSRPFIDDLPNGKRHAFGSTFGVDVTASEGTITDVVLLRPAALTHHFDTDQRYIELGVSGAGAGPGSYSLTVTAPGDDLGPAGWYMLFVIEEKSNGDRVPSVAKFVRLF